MLYRHLGESPIRTSFLQHMRNDSLSCTCCIVIWVRQASVMVAANDPARLSSLCRCTIACVSVDVARCWGAELLQTFQSQVATCLFFPFALTMVLLVTTSAENKLGSLLLQQCPMIRLELWAQYVVLHAATDTLHDGSSQHAFSLLVLPKK